MNDQPLVARARLFHSPTGALVEFTMDPEKSPEIRVYLVELTSDISVQFAHLLEPDVLENLQKIEARYGLWTSQERRWETFFVGTAVAAGSVDVWKKRAKGTLLQRVQCVLDLVVALGPDALGLSSEQVSKEALTLRWFPQIQPGPCTTWGITQQACVNELLFLLRTVNPAAFTETFQYLQQLTPDEWFKYGDRYEQRVVEQINFAILPEHRVVFHDGRYHIEKE